MNLQVLLRLQISYLFLGVLYNCISIILKLHGGRGLSSTSAVAGLAVMATYGLFLIPGFKNKLIIYRFLMGISLLGLGYGGVVTHILNYESLNLYFSPAAWITAIIINTYGLILNIVAFSGKYK